MNYVNSLVIVIITGLSFHFSAIAQVGVNEAQPTETLEVGGVIYSNTDGFKFPDGSVQTKAANTSSPSNAADSRDIIVMEAHEILGSFSWDIHTDCMKVIDLDWGVKVPVNDSTGFPEGTRKHKKLTITKDIDMDSPVWIEKLVDGNIIRDISLFFYWTDPNLHTQVNYYTIVLEDVRVINFDHQMVFVDAGYAHMDVISLTFEVITWTWEDSGITFTDDLHNMPSMELIEK